MYGMVSILYESIQRTASPSLGHIRRQWEEELGIVTQLGNGNRIGALIISMHQTQVIAI